MKKKKDDDRDLLDHLGDFIEEHFKKGVKKVEGIIKEDTEKFKSKYDDKFSYVRAMIDDKAVAAVMPSSKFVVEKVVKAMNLPACKTIVEYGAAEGVITRPILKRMNPDARLVALETNPKLVKVLERIDDDRLTVVNGDVRKIRSILEPLGITEVDAFVSGVPFSMFRGRERHELMLQTSEMLSPKGRFVAYQVTTHLIPLLEDYFSEFKTQFELRNLPPHFIFTAFK